MAFEISRHSFFDVWYANSKETRPAALLYHIMQELGLSHVSDEVSKGLKTQISGFSSKIEKKWALSGRHRDRFLSGNSAWLSNNISFANIINEPRVTLPQLETSRRTGRPRKDFSSSSEKTKKRRIQNLLESSSTEEVVMATELQLRRSGKRDSATIVKELSSSSPRRGTTIKKARKCLQSPRQRGLSDDQALALLVDANLSTHQYITIREQTKSFNKEIYPPYYKVKGAKALCYPSDINVTETYAEIKLQSLVDHTIMRLCKAQREVLEMIPDLSSLEIIVKWGCDGAEQNRYKQKFSEENVSDESMFSISMVPLQMYVINGQSSGKIIWHNPSPSSTRYCRPIKFLFAKETAHLIVTEVDNIKQQVTSLIPTKILVNGVDDVEVKPTMIFCMIDCKICNAVASCASTQTCYLCGAKPSQMNNELLFSRNSLKSEYLSLGLSPLHSWIRFFECILHISYRLEIRTWQARGEENKKKVAEKKKAVQEQFRRELGLLVDMPKQQTGNTNDGNTARKFFRNSEKSAEITGVDFQLIKHFHILLETINCGYAIDLEKFDNYAKETRELYIQSYSWYSMPVSVHKILYHGKDIIRACILPIGQLSEEAQEARNKHNRKFRELFTRKTSRINTNTDLINRLLITSDPFIASLRAAPKTKKGKILAEVYQLLDSITPTEPGTSQSHTQNERPSQEVFEDSDEGSEELDSDS